MRSIKPLLAVLGLILSAGAMAAPVTDLFTVTLPGAQSVYSAGHVFSFTVSYDDAGTTMHQWRDGANGVAEFGQGDDLLDITYDLADPANAGDTLLSDAQVSITGLESPPFSMPLDWYSVNMMLYYEYGNPATDGYWYVYGVSDNISFYLFGVGADYNDNGAVQGFGVDQHYSFDGGTGTSVVRLENDYSVTRERITTSVPEPGTLALLGIGVIGIALYGRRKQRSRDRIGGRCRD